MNPQFKDIPGAQNWVVFRPINEGWSADQKFYIQDQTGKEFLLRISGKDSFEKEQSLYKALKDLGKKNIPVSRLLGSGKCNEGNNTYRIFSWVKGQEIKGVLLSLSQNQQYDYGYQAGRILKEIHKVPCPKNHPQWAGQYSVKIDRKMELYENCGMTIKNADKLFAFVSKHRSLIENRPQSFHHGDYHIGNMLITPEKSLAVIDFNRLDFGDPWEEFNRIPWSAMSSPAFANGQINGYFESDVPQQFFHLMALYIAVNLLGSISWAIPFGQQEVNTILDQIEKVMDWYDDFDLVVPKWYERER